MSQMIRHGERWASVNGRPVIVNDQLYASLTLRGALDNDEDAVQKLCARVSELEMEVKRLRNSGQ